MMKSSFGFLVFDQFEDLDLVGPWEMIALWSKHYGGPEETCIISETGKLITSTKGLSIQPHYSFEQAPSLDYLLVPGGQGTRKEISNTHLLSFIKTQSAHCQHILSVCTGAFLLHAAGLLDGKKATTHWASMERFREFKEVEVVEQRFVRDGNIWTSAGVSAGIDLALAFIAAIAGDTIAGKVQLHAEYYPLNTIYPTK
jgi:transcriptional regulator GlxA family with amidase domain